LFGFSSLIFDSCWQVFGLFHGIRQFSSDFTSFLVFVFILFCCWLILALSKGDICELLHFHNFFTFKGDTCEAFSQKQCFHFLDRFWNFWTQCALVALACVACTCGLASSLTAAACPREGGKEGRDDSTED